jgi:hypothetical protein
MDTLGLATLVPGLGRIIGGVGQLPSLRASRRSAFRVRSLV